MNIGRNDPCTCGSGKKYKKCCLVEAQPSQDEFKKRRWYAIQVGLIHKIMSHAVECYGPDAIHEAYNEFKLFETEDGFDPESSELPIFIPWFFYEWYPDGEESLIEGAPEIPPAQSLAEIGRGLTDDERAYLLECCLTSFSFFEILEINPDVSLKLKDILTEEYHSVLDKKATQGVQKGDLLFGKVIRIDDLDILEACAPIIIKPSFKLDVLEFKKLIQKKNREITQDLLHEYGMEVLEAYRAIYERATNPPMPILTNTDGHLMIPHKMIFDIENPSDTFGALHNLCFNESKEELLEQAKLNGRGEVLSVEFPWLKKGNKKHKAWDNTVLGHIHIDGRKMTVDVNSKERAKKFQTQLKKLMPSGWKLKSTLIESIESQLKKTKTVGKGTTATESEHDELMKIPEIRQRMEDMMKDHWDNWVMDSIPALGGLRPVDAVKTKEGREKLDALLTQFERDATTRPMLGQTVETIRSVRARLGM
jgi:hypothetical protein